MKKALFGTSETINFDLKLHPGRVLSFSIWGLCTNRDGERRGALNLKSQPFYQCSRKKETPYKTQLLCVEPREKPVELRLRPSAVEDSRKKRKRTPLLLNKQYMFSVCKCFLMSNLY